MLMHGWAGNSHQPARLGNVGVARGHVSLIVEDILIPHWVLDPRQSSWTARFH
jgi:hypothetical protein